MFESGLTILRYISQGFGTTVSIFLAAAALAFLMAFIAGLCRLSGNIIIRGFTAFYVEVFRGTSLIVQLFWLYYAVPMLFGINLGSNWWIGVIAIALNYGAYMSEVVRTSVFSFDIGDSKCISMYSLTCQISIHVSSR